MTPARAVVSISLAALGTAACGGADGKPPQNRDREQTRRGGFVEVAEAAGIDFRTHFLASEQGPNFKINLYDHGSGVVVADADGDGRDDLYFLNQLGPNALYLNRGGGKFEDVTAAAGVALDDRICTAAAFADYDNDGDQDLFVASTRGGNVLFRNDGSARFEDHTKAAGLELVAHSQGLTFLDYDTDGDLDLFLSNTAEWTLDRLSPDGRYYLGPSSLFDLVWSTPEPNVLYRNEGDGTFADVTAEAGLAGIGWGGDVVGFDADEDGDSDLFVSNMFGRSTYYRNDAGHFTDITDEAMGRTSWGTVGCKPLDQDGDGRVDLLLVDMHSDMWMPSTTPRDQIDETAKYAGPEGPMVEWGQMSPAERNDFRERVSADVGSGIFGNTLMRNVGGGRFEEVSDAVGAETFWPWGIAAADFDLDGFEDVFLPSGMGYPYFYWPNGLLMNEGGKRFVHGEREHGIEPRPGGQYLERPIAGHDAARSSRSAAVLDYDEDGRPDLAVNNFNERAYLYHNEFPVRRWVAFRLRGTKSNRDAIGAALHLRAGDSTQVRHVLSASGYLAQSTRTLYFGLGDHERIDACWIIWPGGARQELGELELDRVHDVVEPE